jgi:hypothetical protein
MHAPTKNRRGRKAYKPTHQVREQVMTLAAANMTLPEIAAAWILAAPHSASISRQSSLAGAPCV